MRRLLLLPAIALAAALAVSACTTTYGSVDQAPTDTFRSPNQIDR